MKNSFFEKFNVIYELADPSINMWKKEQKEILREIELSEKVNSLYFQIQNGDFKELE